MNDSDEDKVPDSPKEKLQNSRIYEFLKNNRFSVWFENLSLLKQVGVGLSLAVFIFAVVLVISVAVSSLSLHVLNPLVYMIDYPGSGTDAVNPGPSSLDVIIFPTYVANTDGAYSQKFDQKVYKPNGDIQKHLTIYEEYSMASERYYRDVKISEDSEEEEYTEFEFKTRNYRYYEDSESDVPTEVTTRDFKFAYNGHDSWKEYLRTLSMAKWHATGTKMYKGEKVIVYKSVGMEDNKFSNTVNLQSIDAKAYVASKEVETENSGTVDLPVIVHAEYEYEFKQDGKIQRSTGVYTVEEIDSVTVPEGADPSKAEEDSGDDSSEN